MPIFINSIPVALSIDAYVIAILASFLIHETLPILREVMNVSHRSEGIEESQHWFWKTPSS